MAANKGGGAHAVDLHVGRRIRQRRQELDVSQEKLAAALGVTFQQVQKYELGRNRVSASRLWSISRALNVSPIYFFQDAAPPNDPPAAAGAPSAGGEPMLIPEARELSELLLRLAPRRRRRVLDVICAAAEAAEAAAVEAGDGGLD